MTKRFMKRTEAYEQAHVYLNNKRKKKLLSSKEQNRIATRFSCFELSETMSKIMRKPNSYWSFNFQLICIFTMLLDTFLYFEFRVRLQFQLVFAVLFAFISFFLFSSVTVSVVNWRIKLNIYSNNENKKSEASQIWKFNFSLFNIQTFFY